MGCEESCRRYEHTAKFGTCVGRCFLAAVKTATAITQRWERRKAISRRRRSALANEVEHIAKSKLGKRSGLTLESRKLSEAAQLYLLQLLAFFNYRGLFESA